MQTKQSNARIQDEAPVDVVWKLFERTGQIGWYLLYSQLSDKAEEAWGLERAKARVASQAAES